MNLYIRMEAELAALSFILGIILMISYDCLRLFRLLIPHGVWWTGMEDLAYWLYCAGMTFTLLFRENSGVLRGYVIGCVFLGMFLYDRLVSERMFRLLKKLTKWITIRLSMFRHRKEMKMYGCETKNKKKT